MVDKLFHRLSESLLWHEVAFMWILPFAKSFFRIFPKPHKCIKTDRDKMWQYRRSALYRQGSVTNVENAILQNVVIDKTVQQKHITHYLYIIISHRCPSALPLVVVCHWSWPKPCKSLWCCCFPQTPDYKTEALHRPSWWHHRAASVLVTEAPPPLSAGQIVFSN